MYNFSTSFWKSDIYEAENDDGIGIDDQFFHINSSTVCPKYTCHRHMSAAFTLK